MVGMPQCLDDLQCSNGTVTMHHFWSECASDFTITKPMYTIDNTIINIKTLHI